MCARFVCAVNVWATRRETIGIPAGGGELLLVYRHRFDNINASFVSDSKVYRFRRWFDVDKDLDCYAIIARICSIMYGGSVLLVLDKLELLD